MHICCYSSCLPLSYYLFRVMAVPATVLYFSLYENVLDWIRKSYEGNFWSPMIAGSAARLASTTVVSPLEMVRTKMQSERLTYYGIFHCFTIIFHFSSHMDYFNFNFYLFIFSISLFLIFNY